VEIAVAIVVFIIGMIICRSEKRLKIVKLAVILVGLIAIGVLGNKTLPKIKGVIPTQTAITQQADITQNVNFRKGASTNDEVIRQLKKGDTVTLTGETSGGWKRDNYSNTLTFTPNNLKASSQPFSWNFVSASGNAFTIRSDSGSGASAQLNIRLVNNNIEISGNSGGGEDNWNGTWKKQ